MKYILLIHFLLLFLPNNILSQQAPKGKLNKFGCFQYNNKKTYLSHISFIKKNKLNGEFIIDVAVSIKPQNKSYKLLMTRQSLEMHKDIFKHDSLLCQTNYISSIDSIRLNEFFVDQRIYNYIRKMSDSDFYQKYIGQSGVVNCEDPETKKAVLMRLVRSNVAVGIDDISGEFIVGKSVIDWR